MTSVDLQSAPTFLPGSAGPDGTAWEKELEDENVRLSLTAHAGRPVAYMKAVPASDDACHIIRDQATASVTVAFTEEEFRGRGIGAALLNCSLQWARSSGRQRCALDFEPMNVVAARFWLQHFKPICHTVLRTVDI